MIAIHVTFLCATFSTAHSIDQIFSVKSFKAFEDRDNTKLARSVLPACFCLFAFANSQVEFFSWFSTRNSLASRVVSCFGFFAATQNFCQQSFVFYFCRLLLMVFFQGYLCVLGWDVLHCERPQCLPLQCTCKYYSSYYATQKS